MNLSLNQFVKKSKSSEGKHKEPYASEGKSYDNNRMAHQTFPIQLKSIGAAQAAAALFSEKSAHNKKLKILLHENNERIATTRAGLAMCELHKRQLSGVKEG